MSATVSDLPPDLGSVPWRACIGQHGGFEKAVNDGSAAYRRLLEALKRHGGSADSNGFHAWVFLDGITIGRRPKRNE